MGASKGAKVDKDSKDGKKYFRDGAKYVCGQCKKKFFTKEDVENCYDSH